ncbi:uncharacterized protein METZ01_LOCUS219487 [marine metagenome]|uniref:Uncharacterized protein n=1 Tax=marine metagenome TaxID=408172 RepID=A0A382FWI6_9ZZZZ
MVLLWSVGCAEQNSAMMVEAVFDYNKQ